jgi:hypothetical protein
MAVDNPEVVDAIGVDEEQNVVLTIFDHLEWEMEDHLQILQDKINAYLGFVEDGELVENYPDAKGRRVAINIMAQFEPNEEGVDFLDKVKTILEEAGYQLFFQVFVAGDDEETEGEEK